MADRLTDDELDAMEARPNAALDAAGYRLTPADTPTVEAVNPATCGDDEWHRETGACGGCGRDTCHPDKPCDGRLCRRCPTRHNQGWFTPTAPAAQVEAAADRLVRFQSARLDGFDVRLVDLDPASREDALNDARAALGVPTEDGGSRDPMA